MRVKVNLVDEHATLTTTDPGVAIRERLAVLTAAHQTVYHAVADKMVSSKTGWAFLRHCKTVQEELRQALRREQWRTAQRKARGGEA